MTNERLSIRTPELIQRLLAIHSTLDGVLGDTDISHIESDEELKERHPVQWAAQEIAVILSCLQGEPLAEELADSDPLITELIWEVDRAVKQATRENGRYDTVLRHIVNKHLSRLRAPVGK